MRGGFSLYINNTIMENNYSYRAFSAFGKDIYRICDLIQCESFHLIYEDGFICNLLKNMWFSSFVHAGKIRGFILMRF